MIAYVLPTRDRHEELARTLGAIGALGAHPETPAEVIVVDNASAEPARTPALLPNGVAVRVVRLESNEGAAARNIGAEHAGESAEWVVMLDDDSAPTDSDFANALRTQEAHVGAVSADISLPDGSRERGGLPEVFIGCGVAIRRGLFRDLGGYDASFGYYVEEYDLAARIAMRRMRVQFEPRFRVMHRKVTAGRDMDLILERLVRNNAWVIQRYCPGDELGERLKENFARYGDIARKESAVSGYERGVAQWEQTKDAQRRTPMTRAQWDRFTGLAAAREAVARAHRERPFATAQIVEPGKNAWAVERALREAGVEIVEHAGEVSVIGTMSPGPMLDAAVRARVRGVRVVVPWIEGARALERAWAAA